jgi:hypothetical protein
LAEEESEGELAGVVAIAEAWKINQYDAKLLGRTSICSWNLDHRFSVLDVSFQRTKQTIVFCLEEADKV